MRNLYWVGGSVCSGKSSVVRELERRWGISTYHFDAHEREHLDRLRRGHQIYERLPESAARPKLDGRWLHRPPAEMAERTIRSWSDRFPLVVEDLEALGRDQIVVEGAGLFPELVQPRMKSKGHGVWLVATPEFLRWARSERGMTAPSLTSDPARAVDNIIARDILMAQRIRHSAEALALRVITVDGTRSIEETAALIGDALSFPCEGG